MRVHNFAYLVKQGAKNVFHNKLMSFACIGVLVACFLLIGLSVLAILSINGIVGQVEQENQVSLFMDDRLSTSDLEVVELELENMDNIIEVRYIPREESLESLIRAEDAGEIWEDLQRDNPLPNTYIVRIGDNTRFEETFEALGSIEGVIRIKGSPEIAQILVGLRQVVIYTGIAIVAILIVVSVVIITNTIKLTVFSRRKEINIMKYVGATDTFIRFPFLIEGMLIGLVAAFVAFLVLGFGYTYLLEWFAENYREFIFLSVIMENAVDFQSVALYIFGSFAVIGCFIGMAGSGMFVRKFLKV